MKEFNQQSEDLLERRAQTLKRIKALLLHIQQLLTRVAQAIEQQPIGSQLGDRESQTCNCCPSKKDTN